MSFAEYNTIEQRITYSMSLKTAKNCCDALKYDAGCGQVLGRRIALGQFGSAAQLSWRADVMDSCSRRKYP